MRSNGSGQTLLDESCKIKMDETGYMELLTELEKYQKRGVDILLDGYYASPLQIVTAHMIREEGAYMRDYQIGQDGIIQSLHFTNICECRQVEITP